MLTKLEEKILQCITQHIAQHGHAPTLMEIGDIVGVQSKGTIHRYVDSLVSKGHLHKDGRGWRGIRLTGEQDRRLTILPILGRIAAGRPIEAIETEQEINFSDLLLGPNRYVLEVKGESMIDEGIFDGDWVIIEQQETANNGEIVVAIIDNDEATLKRFKNHGDRVELIPANPSMATMVYPANRVKIQGKLIGQMRLY